MWLTDPNINYRWWCALEELYQCDRKLWLLFVGLPNLQLLSPPAKTWARGPAWASPANLEGAPFNRALCVQSHDILYKVSRDILYTPALVPPGPERL